MSDLLSAGIYRYRKSAMFWIMLAITLILGMVVGMIADSSYDVEITYFAGLFLVIAIQSSLMVGIEFSNGVVRNKLVAGHGKGMVFLSELVLSLIAATLLFVVFYGAFAVFNMQWLDDIDARDMAVVVVGLWLVHLSLAAVCTAICFFIPYYSAIAAVLNIVLVIAMAFVGNDLRSKFDEPEYIYMYTHDENGNMIPVYDDNRNPKYIPRDSAEYFLLHTAYYIMPNGQLIDYCSAVSKKQWVGTIKEKYMDDLKTAPLYSLLTIGICTAAGLICFRKKNLK